MAANLSPEASGESRKNASKTNRSSWSAGSETGARNPEMALDPVPTKS